MSVRLDARVASAVTLVLGATALACGSESSPESDVDSGGGTGGSAAGSGAAGSGAAGASGSGFGGQAGSGSGGASGGPQAGAGGTDALNCSGAFGPPTAVLAIPNTEIGGLAVGADERELIYGAGPLDADSPRGFFRSVRPSTSVAFGAGTPLSELDAVCLPTDFRSGDLTNDGLRFYFVCYASVETPAVPLRLARRAAPDMPFAVDPQTYGDVSTGPTISSDELGLFTSPSVLGMPPLRYTRGSTAEPFGAPTELTSLGPMQTPDLSADDLLLFGSRSDGMSANYEIVAAARSAPSADFMAPSVAFARGAVEGALGSAAISADCRSLYYVDVALDTGGSLAFTAMVVRR